MQQIGISLITAGSIYRHAIAHDEGIHHALGDAVPAVGRRSEFHYRIGYSDRLVIVSPEQYFLIPAHVGCTEHIEIRVRWSIRTALEHSCIFRQGIFVGNDLGLIHGNLQEIFDLAVYIARRELIATVIVFAGTGPVRSVRDKRRTLEIFFPGAFIQSHPRLHEMRAVLVQPVGTADRRDFRHIFNRPVQISEYEPCDFIARGPFACSNQIIKIVCNRLLHNREIPESLQLVEIAPCPEKIGLADIMSDIGLDTGYLPCLIKRKYEIEEIVASVDFGKGIRSSRLGYPPVARGKDIARVGCRHVVGMRIIAPSAPGIDTVVRQHIIQISRVRPDIVFCRQILVRRQCRQRLLIKESVA